MRRRAVLTMGNPAGYFIDDELAYEPLRELGWQVDAVPWHRIGVEWSDYEVVVIRSPWDYTKHLDAFLGRRVHAPAYDNLRHGRNGTHPAQ